MNISVYVYMYINFLESLVEVENSDYLHRVVETRMVDWEVNICFFLSHFLLKYSHLSLFNKHFLNESLNRERT